jgi:hypothetical protein
MNTKGLKIKIDLAKSCQKTVLCLNKKRRWVLLSVFLVLIGYCAYLWYSHITNPRWSEARRQEYINTKQSGSIFNKDRFDDIVREIEAKRSEYQRNIENIPDIFRLK